MSNRRSFTNTEFVAHVRDYWPLAARLWELDATPPPGANPTLPPITENAFFSLDAEAMSAFCHAIEDLALEEANGRVLAVLPEFKHFEAQRERYEALAIAADEIEVLATGAKPKPVPRVTFTACPSCRAEGFWLVAYEGRHRSALLICRQNDPAEKFDTATFTGFYALHPEVIARFAQFARAREASQRGALAREFNRLLAIGRAERQMKSEFQRELDTAFSAIRLPATGEERAQAKHFASDLEKALTRLHAWKDRLPRLLDQSESR